MHRPLKSPRNGVVPAHGNTAPHDHVASWLDLVASGAIASDPLTTPAQHLTHLRNEEAVLGRARSLTFPTPKPYTGRR